MVSVASEARFALAARNFVAVHDTNQDSLVSTHEFSAVYFSLWSGNDFFRRMVLRALHWMHLDENQDDEVTFEEISRLFPGANLSQVPDPLTYELRLVLVLSSFSSPFFL